MLSARIHATISISSGISNLATTSAWCWKEINACRRSCSPLRPPDARAWGEKGVFEPELTGSAQHVANHRPNTVEQQRTLSGVPILDERNNIFDTGVESLAVTGAKVRLGYTLSNLNNNLPPFGILAQNSPRTDQWQSFTGITITQPLLKNAGATTAMAGIRLAALNSETAFQEYRRELMLTLQKPSGMKWLPFLWFGKKAGQHSAHERSSDADEGGQEKAHVLHSWHDGTRD